MKGYLYEQPHGDDAVAADLAAYASRVTALNHPALLPVIDVLQDDSSGRWALLFPPVGRVLNLTEAVDLASRDATACAIALSIADAFLYLHQADMRGAESFDWSDMVRATYAGGAFRLCLLPPDPARMSADREGLMWGNPWFMARETMAGKPFSPTPASDSFSVGVLLFQLLTGEPLVQAANAGDAVHEIHAGRFRTAAMIRPSIDPRLSAFVERATSIDAAARPTLREWSFVMEQFGGALLPSSGSRAGADADTTVVRVAPAADTPTWRSVLPARRATYVLSLLRRFGSGGTRSDALVEFESMPTTSPAGSGPDTVSAPTMTAGPDSGSWPAADAAEALVERVVQPWEPPTPARRVPAPPVAASPPAEIVAAPARATIQPPAARMPPPDPPPPGPPPIATGLPPVGAGVEPGSSIWDRVTKAMWPGSRSIERDEERSAAKAPAVADEARLPPSIASHGTTRGTPDLVDCSVFAPPAIYISTEAMVQVFLHKPKQLEQARTLAKEIDAGAQRVGWQALELPIPPGTRLQIHLSLPGLEVDDAVQDLTWRGRAAAVQFVARVPDGYRPGNLFGKATVYREGLPLGHIKFKLAIKVFNKDETWPGAQPLGTEAQPYRLAFISYASEDRKEVLKRVQMLERFHVRYFQDLLSLEPGARWEQQLYKHIDECDLFLLFWSSHARQSEWVGREIAHALGRKGDNDLAPPEIVPVIIEGPPVPPPPDGLRHLHFDDRLIHVIPG